MSDVVRKLFVLSIALGSFACATAQPRLAPKWIERSKTRAELSAGQVAVRWLGTAGFEVRTKDAVLLLDPFLTRPNLAEIMFLRLVPDEETLKNTLPRADLILIGHSHYDHLMDTPAIAKRTGAIVYGTKTTCLVSRAMGLPRPQCVRVKNGDEIVRGPFRVTVLRSEHGKAPIIGVPFPGELKKPPRWRHPHAIDLPMGGALVFVIRVEGMTLVHFSSANFPENVAIFREAVPEGADVLLPSIAIRERTTGYARTLIAQLRPRVIIPHHHDPLLGTLEEPLPQKSQTDVADFAREASGAHVLSPTPFEEIIFDREKLNRFTNSGESRLRASRDRTAF